MQKKAGIVMKTLSAKSKTIPRFVIKLSKDYNNTNLRERGIAKEA